jgi:hypothetical protein
MNNIIIKVKIIKRELWIFFSVFVFTFLLNIYSIHYYKTSWSELYTHINVVVLMSIVFYVFIVVVRLLIGFLLKIFHKKTTK